MSYYGDWCHTKLDELMWRKQFIKKQLPLVSVEFICRHRCYELHPELIKCHPGITFIDTTDWPNVEDSSTTHTLP